MEIIQTVKSHGLANIDDKSSESFESSSFDSDDSLHSNHSEEEIEEMPPLYTPSFKRDLTGWSFQTASILPRSPQTPSLQRLTRKLTKKDLITSNNSNRTTTKQVLFLNPRYLGDSMISYDESFLQNPPPKLSLQKQLISSKTLNNVFQNDINQKSIEIKQLEEEIVVSELKEVHCSKQLKITRRIIQEQQINITKMDDYYTKYQQELINEIEELQNKVDINEKYIEDLQNELKTERGSFQDITNINIHSDELPQIHSLPGLVGNHHSKISVQEQLITLKTMNNVLQNEIDDKTTKIKQLEDQLNELKVKIMKRIQKLTKHNEKLENDQQKLMSNIGQQQNEIKEKSKEIVDWRNILETTKSTCTNIHFDELPQIHSLPGLVTKINSNNTTISVEEQLISLKTINNVLQNEINNKTIKIKQMEEDHLNELKVKRFIFQELENNMQRIQKLMSNISQQQNEIKEKSKEIVVCELKLVHCLDELNGTKLIIDEQKMNITKMKNDDDENKKYQQKLTNQIDELQKDITFWQKEKIF